MSGFVPGSVRYHKSLDGVPTIGVCVVRRRNTVEGCYVYLVAVPVSADDPRGRTARDGQTGEELFVKVLAIAAKDIGQFKREPMARWNMTVDQFMQWPDDRRPRLDDLERIVNDPSALPLNAAENGLVMSGADGAEGDQEEEEVESDAFQAAGRRLAVAARFLAPVAVEAPERPAAAPVRPVSGDARSPELPDFAAQMDAALKRALDPIGERLTALENAPPRPTPSSAPPGSAAPLSSEMGRFMARRPGGMAASQVPLAPQSKAAPRKATVLLEEDFGSEEDELDPRERPYSRREPSYSQRALFRLEGARG